MDDQTKRIINSGSIQLIDDDYVYYYLVHTEKETEEVEVNRDQHHEIQKWIAENNIDCILGLACYELSNMTNKQRVYFKLKWC